jgi:hypothetical protein
VRQIRWIRFRGEAARLIALIFEDELERGMYVYDHEGD